MYLGGFVSVGSLSLFSAYSSGGVEWSGVERPSLSTVTVLDSRLSSRADLQVATPVCLFDTINL